MQVTGLIRQGQLDQSAAVDSADEIGRLAESFNVMTASLRGSFEELRQQRQFLENVINSIRDEIVVVDSEGNVVTANQAARDHQSGDSGAFSTSLTLETFQTGAPGKRLDVIPTPEGEERHLEVYWPPGFPTKSITHSVLSPRQWTDYAGELQAEPNYLGRQRTRWRRLSPASRVKSNGRGRSPTG
jgi:hypothetical protein